MKRQVLFVGCEPPYQAEIHEFLKSHGGEVRFADSPSVAVSILEAHPIDAVVLCGSGLPDTAFMRYLEDIHPNVKVIVSAGGEFESIARAFSNGRYSLVNDYLEKKKKLTNA
jgi:CheY-like chemotaxis protein